MDVSEGVVALELALEALFEGTILRSPKEGPLLFQETFQEAQLDIDGSRDVRRAYISVEALRDV